MNVTIKIVKRCSGDDCGQFVTISKNRYQILIAEKHNKSIGEFADTLLHELLHLWVTVLEHNGLKEDIRREHRFINEVLPILIQKFAKHYR
jgi:hypothetical protein